MNQRVCTRRPETIDWNSRIRRRLSASSSVVCVRSPVKTTKSGSRGSALTEKRMLIALLSGWAWASLPRSSGNAAPGGTWRGVVREGLVESVVWFDVTRPDARYRGNYWGMAPPRERVALTGVELGHSVRFEVPRMGVFEGEIAGETMEGTFVDAQGAGSFQLAKQQDWDALQAGP